MSKIIRFISMSLMFAFLCQMPASGQTVKRIQFEKGKSSTIVKGSTGEYGVTYVVRAKSGQKLVIDLTPASKVGIRVDTNSRFGEIVIIREEVGGHYEVGIEETGDYTILVGSTTGKPVQFTLAVKIGKLADI
jgi:hypothetical protein